MYILRFLKKIKRSERFEDTGQIKIIWERSHVSFPQGRLVQKIETFKESW